MKRHMVRKGLLVLVVVVVAAATGLAYLYFDSARRVVIQFDVHQNKEAIYLSTFAEPPQFAIWIEDPKAEDRKTVFVTKRVGTGDWEGKSNVPVALPRWYALFKGAANPDQVRSDDGYDYAVTGATPKEDYFSVRIQVPPGSEWICWIEMNLAGDFNEAFPEFNTQTLKEDEFSCGQPALLYRAELRAVVGEAIVPELVSQSVWEDGEHRAEPVSAGITTAKTVFDTIRISVLQPKIKLVEDKVEYM